MNLIFRMLVCAFVASAAGASAAEQRNVILFIADGLRNGSVNSTDAPTLLSIRERGVNFTNSHSLYPTLTTPNASAIATGHYLGDTGDFSNTVCSAAQARPPDCRLPGRPGLCGRPVRGQPLGPDTGCLAAQRDRPRGPCR